MGAAGSARATPDRGNIWCVPAHSKALGGMYVSVSRCTTDEC